MTNGNGNTALAVRQDQFAGALTQGVGETAALAIAAQAKAAIEARWIVAMKCPRDMDQVRADVLRECKRPAFAEVARYLKPIGEGVEGPSIRFVEAALQALGNCDTQAITIYDDAEKRIVEVSVIDFEKNVTHRKQITISKVVERRYLRKNQTALASRTNSRGDTVYLVSASDDDLLNKEAALVSKAIRTCGLRIIPGWLVEEAMGAVIRTQKDQAARDPDAERRKVADAFASINVQPAELSRYLGHDLGKVSPGELAELRQVYATIRDGQASWSDILDHRLAQRGEKSAGQAGDQEAPKPSQEAPKRGAAAAKAAIRSARPAPAPAPQEPAEEEPPPAEPEVSAAPPARARRPKPQAAKGAPRRRQAPAKAPEPPPEEIPEDERRMAAIEAQQAQEPEEEPEEPQGEFDLDPADAVDAELVEGEDYDPDTGEVFEEEAEAEAEEPGEEDEFQEPEWMRAPEAPPQRGKKPPKGEAF